MERLVYGSNWNANWNARSNEGGPQTGDASATITAHEDVGLREHKRVFKITAQG